MTHCSTLLFQSYRFLQGPETDQSTVSKVRDAIREQREITVQLINYTKSGKYVISISWCCKCTPFLVECHSFLIDPWILEIQFIICLQIFYDTIFGRTRYCPLLKTINIFSVTMMNFYVSLHAGKKFWNLFHLQPMRDQKVYNCYCRQFFEFLCWSWAVILVGL